MKFPKPTPNINEYKRIMERGFARFPERKRNYDKFKEMCSLNAYAAESECMPIKMDYEVSNRCNFNCKMCLIQKKDVSLLPPQMSFGDFVKTLEEQYGLIEIKLQGTGEPLLNPDFFKIVHAIVEKDIWCRTITNASLLHLNSSYKKLIDEKVGEIQVSIDGATKESFEKIRVGSNFEQIVENSRLLNQYAQERGEEWRTSCWMLVQKDNYHEMSQLLDLAEYMRFTRVVFSLDVNNWGHEDFSAVTDELNVRSLITDELLEELIDKGRKKGIEVAVWSDADKYTYTKAHDKLCNWLWERAFISADMQIAPCCVLSDADMCDLGSALDFEKSWNAVEYKNIRKLHLEGDIPPMCRNCYQ